MSSQDGVLHHTDPAIKMALGAALRVVRQRKYVVINGGRKSPPTLIRIRMGRPQDIAPTMEEQETAIGSALELLVQRSVLEVVPADDGTMAYQLGPKAPPPSVGLERRLKRRRAPSRARQPSFVG